VKPETVVAGHRRRRLGRPTVPADVRVLIRTTSQPTRDGAHRGSTANFVDFLGVSYSSKASLPRSAPGRSFNSRWSPRIGKAPSLADCWRRGSRKRRNNRARVGCGYRSKVGGAVLSAGLVGIMAGAPAWR